MIDEKKLSSWKLLDDFRRRLAKIQADTPKPPARPGGPQRLLLEEDYLFFKWLKSIGCRHLMAESPEGVAIQIYSALIAALMLQLLTGKRPGKRAMELIRFHMMGYAGLDEIIALLNLEKTKA